MHVNSHVKIAKRVVLMAVLLVQYARTHVLLHVPRFVSGIVSHALTVVRLLVK